MFLQKYLMELFDTFLDPALKFVRKQAVQLIDAVSPVHMYILDLCIMSGGASRKHLHT